MCVSARMHVCACVCACVCVCGCVCTCIIIIIINTICVWLQWECDRVRGEWGSVHKSIQVPACWEWENINTYRYCKHTVCIYNIHIMIFNIHVYNIPVNPYGLKYKKIIILGGYGHIGKWIQENIIFMRFCCCFKLSKKTEKLSNKQLTHAIAKCTLTGLMQ